MEKKVLKGTRWLLLKNPENLVEERKRASATCKRPGTHQPAGHRLLNERRFAPAWWSQKTRKRSPGSWRLIARARVSRHLHAGEVCDTLQTHRDGILAYYELPDLNRRRWRVRNNKIKTMKRQAYGFRDNEFFKLKIMGIHLTKYALVGMNRLTCKV